MLKINQKFTFVDMKIALSILMVLSINLMFGQVDKDLLKNIIQVRENHLLNQKTTLIWQEYNHTTITSKTENISKLTDTIWKDKTRNIFKIDSSSYKLKQFNSNKHFYQSERNINHERKNGQHRSVITKYKMAGFEQPIYESLALELYSFSIFDNEFYYLHNKEIHPLSIKGLKTYDFEIKENGVEEYIVHFKQKSKSPLFGWFIIDKDSLQIKKAEIKNVAFIDVNVIYENIYSETHQNYLPKKTEILIKKGTRDSDLKIFGKAIYFKLEREKGFFTDEVYVLSTSTYDGFSLKDIINNKKKYISIDFNINENETFRRDNVSFKNDFRNENAYKFIDSLSSQNKIEKRLNIARKLYDGFYPINQLDLNLKRIINYNNYEGFRIGLGLQTNEKFSKRFKSSGHLGYGFDDRKMKYLLKQAMRIGIFSDSWLGIEFQDDIREIGSTKFQTDNEDFIFLNLRPLNLTTFYADRHIKGELNTKILQRTHTVASLSFSDINPLFNYRYLNAGKLFQRFNMTALTLSMQWEPFSKYMQTPNEKIIYKTGFPTFTFQFSESFSGVTKNDFNFQKFDFKTEYQKKFWNGHEIKYFMQSGLILGSTPLTHLYSVFPNSADNPNVFQRFDISGKNTFETMRRNEFFSDRFIFSELIYEIPLHLSKTFEPIISLVSRYGIGNLSDKNQHLDFNFKTMEKGYWESGVEFFNLFNWFGLSAFYRHGPYQLQSFEENISIKLNFRIVI